MYGLLLWFRGYRRRIGGLDWREAEAFRGWGVQGDSGWLERVLLAGWLFDSVDETTSHTLPCNFDFRFDFDS